MSRYDPKATGKTTSAIIGNIYRGPCDEYLLMHGPDQVWLGDAVAVVRFDRFEIQTAMTDEGAFIGLLSARIQSAVDEMVCRLHAQTFPVHDEPFEAA